MIKFLHTADLHLDAPFAALSPEQAAARRQEQRELLTELAEAANTHDCDLVLLAGDLFDSAGASDETLLALRRALAPRFYALTIRDETRPRRALWEGAEEDTLRGLFLQALKAQYDAAQTEADRRKIALAARCGCAAMDGREAAE